MTRRINVVLPVETLKVLDRVAPKGNRSRLISEAVMHYVTSKAKTNLAERIKEGARVQAERDLRIAQEWFPLDEETWEPKKRGRGRQKQVIPAEATSTSSTLILRSAPKSGKPGRH